MSTRWMVVPIDGLLRVAGGAFAVECALAEATGVTSVRQPRHRDGRSCGPHRQAARRREGGRRCGTRGAEKTQ